MFVVRAKLPVLLLFHVIFLALSQAATLDASPQVNFMTLAQRHAWLAFKLAAVKLASVIVHEVRFIWHVWTIFKLNSALEADVIPFINLLTVFLFKNCTSLFEVLQ